MNTTTTSGVQHNALGSESVAIASCDPLLHAPVIAALCPDVSQEMMMPMTMLPGMVSDSHCPVHGYWRRGGAAAVRRQDIRLRMPNVMEFGLWNLVHWHLCHSREACERLSRDSLPVHGTTESDSCRPVRSDLHQSDRTRGELM